MENSTPEELAYQYVYGDLTEVQLNYWIEMRKLDSQKIENLIEYYQGSIRRTMAFIVLIGFLVFTIGFSLVLSVI
ncbi:MAG: hypothetical protein ACW99G_12025 [Candidatus Thorarchaeota archaeon]|jgi:hypothetical protein